MPTGIGETHACRPELDANERALWKTLAADSAVWATEFRGSGHCAFWRRLIVIRSAVESQFDVLREALGNGLSLDAPTAALALEGRGFHGQRSRPWSTRRGNLFLTVALPVGTRAAGLTVGLVMLPAVAVVDAIEAYNHKPTAPGIKWVNDVLMRDRKVAGVLTATVCRGDRVEVALLGIGVNLEKTPPIEPTQFVRRAGCLKDLGVDVSLERFTWTLLDRLAVRYRVLHEEGPGDLLESYRKASCIVGRRVRIWHESTDRVETDPGAESPPPLAAGVVQSIERDLSLRIEGCVHPVTRGRLALEEDCRRFGL
ncbi:MAG: biotin--[acetyl-CoA-carboxylase] ligase [Phycisphaerales bacterium]|nr:MAG: biotin--[acetyl-CoA-carboxylase] ligase [Phycisphaerales bacterium]